MLKVNLPRFHIFLDRLKTDIDKVSLLMEKFEQDRRVAGMHVVGKSFPKQTKLLQTFPLDLRIFIDKLAREQGLDVFGNVYKNWREYDRIEVSVPPTYEVITFRLLGNIEKSSEEQIRYTIFCKKNELDPTTINIISDIRNISDQTISISESGPYQKCSDTQFDLSDISSGVNSSISWTDFVNTYFWPEPNINTVSIPTTPEDIKRFTERFNQNSVKTREELEREDSQLSSYEFKLNIKKNREGGYELNDAGKFTLLNVDKLESDLIAARQNAGEIVKAAYTEVYDKFSLCCLIQSAVECIMPPLSCRDLLRGIPYNTMIDILVKAFGIDRFAVNNPDDSVSATIPQRIVFVIDSTLGQDATKDFLSFSQDRVDFVDSTNDAFYDALEKVVDLESICTFMRSEVCAKEISDQFVFNFPDDIPIIDLFGSVSAEMENAILEALIQALVGLILGVLKDLDSCDELSAFTAAALRGEFGPALDVIDDFETLFIDPQETGRDEERGTLANRLGSTWNKFTNETNDVLNKGARIKAQQGTNFADQVASTADVAVNKEGELLDSFDRESYRFSSGGQLAISDNIPAAMKFQFQTREAFETFVKQGIQKLGRYEISEDDENSFTLSSITDEEIKTILELTNIEAIEGDFCTEASGLFQQFLNEESEEDGQVDFSQNISDLLEETVALLTPGEFIRLIAGEPDETTTTIVKEIVNRRYPELNAAGDPITIFDNLGQITGLNTIRDRLLVLAEGAERDVVNQYCATKQEWEELGELRDSILNNNPNITNEQDIQESITRITETRKRRVQEYFEILSSGPDFDPEEFIECVKCGTGFDTKGVRPPVVDYHLDQALNLMFEGTKMAFDREVGKFATTIDRTITVREEIPRTIIPSQATAGTVNQQGSGIVTFERGEFGQFSVKRKPISEAVKDVTRLAGLSQDLIDTIDGKLAQPIINPEFQGMVNNGYRPTNAEGEIVGTENDIFGPFTAGDAQPVYRVTNRRVPAGVFKHGILSLGAGSFSLKEENNRSSIIISNEATLEAVPVLEDVPKFNLEYAETGEDYNLVIRSNHPSVGQTTNYNFFRKTEQAPENISNFLDALPPSNRQELRNFTESGTNKPTRKGAFNSFIVNKLDGVLRNFTEQDQDSLREQLESQYDELTESLFTSLRRSLRENRLIQKIEGNEEQMVLDLFEFSSTQTPEQRLCKIEPHLLDLESVKQIVKDTYDKECADPLDPLDGITASRSPINSAGFTGVVLTVIRLYVIEYIFRSLFVYDELGYSLSLADDEVLIDYITFRMIQDIKDVSNEYSSRVLDTENSIPNLWNKFREEAIVAFDKMVLSNNIRPEEEQEIGAIDNDNSLGIYTTGPTVGAETEIPKQLKMLVKQTMRSVLFKFSKLLEVEPRSSRASERNYLDTLPIVDTYSKFTDVNYTSFDSRFSNDKEETQSGRFILERYIRVAEEEQKDVFLKNVVNLTNWEQYVSGLDERDLTPFSTGSRFGMRLVYVSPSFDGENENSFKIGEDFGQIDVDEVNKEKAYYIKNYDHIGSQQYKNFNTIIISCAEIEIGEDAVLIEEEGGLLLNFTTLYQERLLSEISKNEDYLAFYKFMLPFERYQSLMVISNTFLMRTPDRGQGENVDNLFDGTKKELFGLFGRMTGLGNYTYDPDFGAVKNAADFQQQFMNIGNPSGPWTSDAFLMWLNAPEPIIELLGAIQAGPAGILTLLTIKLAAAGYFNPAEWFAEGDIPIADYIRIPLDPQTGRVNRAEFERLYPIAAEERNRFIISEDEIPLRENGEPRFLPEGGFVNGLVYELIREDTAFPRLIPVWQISEETLVFNEKFLALDSEFVVVNGKLCVQRAATVTKEEETTTTEVDFFGNETVKQSTETRTRLAKNPVEYRRLFTGEPIPKYTNIYEIQKVPETGENVVDENNKPVIKRNLDGTFVIRQGETGIRGIPAVGPQDRKDPWESVTETVDGFARLIGARLGITAHGGPPGYDPELVPSVRVWPGEPERLSYFETFFNYQLAVGAILLIAGIPALPFLVTLVVASGGTLGILFGLAVANYAASFVGGYAWAAAMDLLKARTPWGRNFNGIAQSATSRTVKNTYGVNPSGARENFVCEDKEN